VALAKRALETEVSQKHPHGTRRRIMDEARRAGQGDDGKIAAGELFRTQILKTIEFIKAALPEEATEYHDKWRELALAAVSETRESVLFAMLQTLREVINAEMPSESQEDVSFQVKDGEGNIRTYKNYKEFLDECLSREA
jgi:hypothetical protein